MSQNCDVFVPKYRNAVFIHRVPVRPPGLLVSLSGVLKGLPRVLLPGLVILFLMGFGSHTMSVSGAVVQLSGAWMVLVM